MSVRSFWAKLSPLETSIDYIALADLFLAEDLAAPIVLSVFLELRVAKGLATGGFRFDFGTMVAVFLPSSSLVYFLDLEGPLETDLECDFELTILLSLLSFLRS